jgi:carbon-monoxide dehydrogenase medium subunit
MALGARVTLSSLRGERELPLEDFYTGVRRTVMESDELLVDIAIPPSPYERKSHFIKLALRRAQAISIVNVAAVLGMEGEEIRQAAITLGAVAPTVIHAEKAAQVLIGEQLSEAVITRAGDAAVEAAQPINDLRGSAAYRREMVRVCTRRALSELAAGSAREGFPAKPITLWGPGEWRWTQNLPETYQHEAGSPIHTKINGKSYTFSSGQNKTLLRLLREEAGLIGTKEGCAEGECGACTVFLDGMAVMACLVPAPRAHAAEVETIEGLAKDGELHPLQEAFIQEGAVQCGYCTPGLIMSGVKLLEECAQPTQSEIQQSITGNLCRCTGYYKILSAIEKAAGR